MKELIAKYPILFGAALLFVAMAAAVPPAALFAAIGLAPELAGALARLLVAGVLLVVFRSDLDWSRSLRGVAWALPALGFVAWNLAYNLAGGAEMVLVSAMPGVLITALAPAVFEELIFRGILIGRLRANGESARWCLWASTLLFCLAHLTNALGLTMGDLIVQLGYSLVIGLVFGAVFLKTGDLASVIGAHLLIDFSSQIFVTTPTVNAIWVYVLFFVLLAAEAAYALWLAKGLDGM